MLNLNKTKIRGIALVLALVTVLAMCLTGCKDVEARKVAEEAKTAAEGKATKADIDAAVANALKDYVKASDLSEGLTLDQVKTQIADSLKDYLKASDAVTKTDVEATVKSALEGYVKVGDPSLLTEAKVNQLIDAAKTQLGQQITTQGEASKAEADKKIDKAAWTNLTSAVVEKCIEVDNQEKAMQANKSNYTAANWAKVEAVYYSAKIRLYRAVDAENLSKIVADIKNEIDAIPTAQTEANEVQKLVALINFPVTTNDVANVAAAQEAFQKWEAKYGFNKIEDREDYLKAVNAKGVNVGLLEYANAKVERLVDGVKDGDVVVLKGYKAIDAEILAFVKKYADDLGVKLTKEVQKVDAGGKPVVGTDNKPVMETVDRTAEEILPDALAAADKVLSTKYEELKSIYAEYVEFVGKPVTFTEAELEKVATSTAEELKKLDEKYDNNGVGKLADNTYLVTYYPVLDAYMDAALADRFNELKTEAIKNVLDKFTAINIDDPTYKTEVTKLGDVFAAVMEAELKWRDSCYTTEYPGDNFEAKFNYAREHLRLVNEAVKAVDDVDGFYVYLEGVAEQATAADRAAYVAEKSTVDFAKQVIIDCYNKINAQSATNDWYEVYKLDAINAIAKYTADFINANANLAQRNKDAAKNIVLAYIPAIRAMSFRDSADYTYSNKGDVADKEAQEHFDVLVAEFKGIIDAIAEKTEPQVVVYEANNVAKATITSVVKVACETAKENVVAGTDEYVAH